MQQTREAAAALVNHQDADMWRWFAELMNQRRIRWSYAHDVWLVSIDHRHVASECDFDRAIRAAKESWPKGKSASL
jgi:hypothetical protein